VNVRKGIYSTFHPNGEVMADERWQLQTLPDGSLQVDNETARFDPFPEPRSDSITGIFRPDLSPELFTLHGLFGHRESRVSWVDNDVFVCWQHGLNTQRRTLPWPPANGFAFASPLLDCVLLRRLNLEVGATRTVKLLSLATLDCAPAWREVEITRASDVAAHPTAFGKMPLRHYSVAHDRGVDHHYTDASHIVFESRLADGMRQWLVAVNFEEG
jgi:hypothetical protein